MNLFMYFVFLIIGFSVSCFFFSNTLITIVFAIPFTKKLNEIGAVREFKKLMLSHKILVLILLIISLLPLVLILLFFKNYIIPYVIGFGFSIIIGFKHFGKNANNIADFLSAYRNYLNTELIEIMLSDGNCFYTDSPIRVVINNPEIIKYFLNHPDEININLFINLNNPYSNQKISTKQDVIAYFKMYLEDYNSEQKKSTT